MIIRVASNQNVSMIILIIFTGFIIVFMAPPSHFVGEAFPFESRSAQRTFRGCSPAAQPQGGRAPPPAGPLLWRRLAAAGTRRSEAPALP